MFPDREKALHVENPLLKAWTCLRHAPGKSRFNHDHEMNGGKSLNELVFWKPLLPKTWMITMMIGCLHFKSFKSPIYNIIIHYITPPRAVSCGRIRLKTDRVQWGKRWLWGPPWSPCLGNRHVPIKKYQESQNLSKRTRILQRIERLKDSKHIRHIRQGSARCTFTCLIRLVATLRDLPQFSDTRCPRSVIVLQVPNVPQGQEILG
jgi:hypothetical protein